MSSEIENKIQSININTLIPTLLFFSAGLIYYYYKFRTTRNDLLNINQERINSGRDGSGSANTNFNVNNGNRDNTQNSDYIKIFIVINNDRKEFYINKNQMIRDFIRDTLNIILNSNSNQKINLICQGRILSESSPFSEYSAISNNTVLHCFITNLINNSNSNASNFQSQNINNNNLLNDPNAVSIFTIYSHLIILFLILLSLYLHKTIDDLLTKDAQLISYMLILVWLTQFSKCIAKLLIHKKIIFN
jgi:hypothetical protein